MCGIEDRNDEAVAGVARELAERYDLPLFFVHVLHGADGHDDAARLLREATAPGNGELAIERGHPADRLVELARDREASFLVVGNHGPRSSLLGSISADVSRRASCPVVVVPPTVEAAGHAPAGSADAHVRGGIVRFELGHAVRRP
jgi:nucleotide-binding universal stress UspA family protein